jgi:hypothetical protein
MSRKAEDVGGAADVAEVREGRYAAPAASLEHLQACCEADMNWRGRPRRQTAGKASECPQLRGDRHRLRPLLLELLIRGAQDQLH